MAPLASMRGVDGRVLESACSSTPRRWLCVGIGLLVVTALVHTQDQSLSALIVGLAPEGSITQRVIKQSYRLYAWWSFVLIAAMLAGHPRRLRLLSAYGAAISTCLGCVHLLKLVVGRARPQFGAGAYHFVPLDVFDACDGFPSGHTAAATLLAALAGLYWPRSRWILFPGALLVGVARVSQERHYVSDITAGAGIALITVHLCVLWLGRGHFPPLRSVDVSGEPETAAQSSVLPEPAPT